MQCSTIIQLFNKCLPSLEVHKDSQYPTALWSLLTGQAPQSKQNKNKVLPLNTIFSIFTASPPFSFQTTNLGMTLSSPLAPISRGSKESTSSVTSDLYSPWDCTAYLKHVLIISLDYRRGLNGILLSIVLIHHRFLLQTLPKGKKTAGLWKHKWLLQRKSSEVLGSTSNFGAQHIRPCLIWLQHHLLPCRTLTCSPENASWCLAFPASVKLIHLSWAPTLHPLPWFLTLKVHQTLQRN